jgi:tetratricopeptide (TPR) repeat protein
MGHNGDLKSALYLGEKMYALDPKGSAGPSRVSDYAFQLRRYNEAERWADIHIANSPEASSGYLDKLRVVIFVFGDLKRAEIVLQEAKKNVTIEKSELADYEHLFYFYKRDYNKALILNESNKFWETRVYNRASLLKLLNRNDEAELCFDSLRIERLEFIKKHSDLTGYDNMLAGAYAGLGDKAKALDEIAKLDSSSLIDYSMFVAYFYILVGDNENAIQLLEKSAAESNVLLPGLLKLSPKLDPIRSDPRFKKIIATAEERIKKAQE